MPIYEFKCTACNRITEKLMRMSQADIREMDCSECSGTAKKIISKLGFKTNHFKGGGIGGINGVYDRGLGARYSNWKERDAIAQAKGVVPLDAIENKYIVEERAALETEKAIIRNKIHDKYEETLAKTGSVAEAQEASMPAEDILAGKFDKVFD